MTNLDTYKEKLTNQEGSAKHTKTWYAKELKCSRSTITRRLEKAGILKERGDLCTVAEIRRSCRDLFKELRETERMASLMKIQSYHNERNERRAVKSHIKRLMKEGDDITFWAAVLCCSESTIRRRIKQAGAYKKRGAIYTGAEMRKICPDLFVKLDKKDAINN